MKRETKQQREDRLRAALLQRLTDIYAGAQGCIWGDDDFANAEVLSRAARVIKDIFAEQKEYSWYWEIGNIHYFDNPQAACDFLFEQGFRA